MKRLWLLFIVWSAVASVSAQVEKFEWEDYTCVYESSFDRRVYSEEQIQNTYNLWKAGDDYHLDMLEVTAFKLDDIPKLRTAASLEAEYKEKLAKLRALQIVNAPFWKNFKAQKIVVLERYYLLSRASVLAYEKPAALREVDFAEACVARFAPPMIAGGDELWRLWREINEKARQDNSDPERVRRAFEQQSVSADKVRYAQMEILTFGWWNCVNDRITRPDVRNDYLVEFRKLFKTTKKTFCETP